MITLPEGTPNHLVTDGQGGLPIGDIAIGPDHKWVFWPSVYRKPIPHEIAGEILQKLRELNNANSRDNN